MLAKRPPPGPFPPVTPHHLRYLSRNLRTITSPVAQLDRAFIRRQRSEVQNPLGRAHPYRNRKRCSHANLSRFLLRLCAKLPAKLATKVHCTATSRKSAIRAKALAGVTATSNAAGGTVRSSAPRPRRFGELSIAKAMAVEAQARLDGEVACRLGLQGRISVPPKA